MSAHRRVVSVPETAVRASREECGRYLAATGHLHPDSVWCGLLAATCGRTGLDCDGACTAERES